MKISIDNDRPAKKEAATHLQAASAGALDAADKIGYILESRHGIHIEVIKIRIANWVPYYDFIHVKMVLSKEGKKEEPEPYILYNPAQGNVQKTVEEWICTTLHTYLTKLHKAAMEEVKIIGAKLEALQPLLPVPEKK